jgi:predicted glycosyltransferase
MARNNQPGNITTRGQADKHEALNPLVSAMYEEFQELSRKKPDGVLNKNKITIMNRLLKDVLTILEKEPSRPYLDLVNEEDIPQNSDVALILSQYRAAMKQFYDRYFGWDESSRKQIWHTK